MFYYAGHGIEVGGENFMIPLNAPIQFEDDVDVEAVSVNLLLAKLASAANRLNIVILDACRNNPYSRSFRSSASGLAHMDAPTGTYIAYAAAPGRVAMDGEGANGLYTGELLKALPLPGIKIEDAFKRVRVAVQEKSGAQQVPWESSSLTGDFYFGSPAAHADASTEASEVSSRDTGADERLFWQSIQNSTDPGMFDEYLRQFPGGTFAGLARRKRDALLEARQQETQTAAIVPPPMPALEIEEMDATFVALKTSNVRAEPTTQSERVGRLTRDDAVAVTGKVTDKNWYRIEHEGETAYIFGTLIKEVDPGELAAWEKVADTTERADVEGFLRAYPKGHFAERAKGLLAVLAPPPAPAPAGTSVEPAVGVYPKTYQPGDTFRDCDACPEMVVIPAGQFMMGSPSYEEGRYDDEGPVHRVQVPSFALGKYEVTRGQFAAFVSETGYEAGGDCYVVEGEETDDTSTLRNWRNTYFSQSDRDPVVCVNWSDAKAYVGWLGRKTGERYRLPSESEWEYAGRAGTTEARYWGNNPNAACTNANVADKLMKQEYTEWTIHDCRDDHVFTAPVGSFQANSFGIYDVLGNVWEWVEDCRNGSYSGAPGDGSAWTRGECDKRTLRGGSWFTEPRLSRSATRATILPDRRDADLGFRVARTLP